MRKLLLAVSLSACVFLTISCKKTLDTYTTSPVKDYYPTVVGKYITYNLDSTVFINFGARDTIIKYQVRDMVDAQIKDNSGRTAFRIIRSIRKNANQAWSGNNTFLVVPTSDGVEYVENNLRFLKLKLPIRERYTWKGNSFIDTYSLNSDVKYLDDWDYTYEHFGEPLTLGSINLDSTVTVQQRDEFLGQSPNLPSTQYAEKNFSKEKYAKGIGMVYKEFVHWEFQGPQPGRLGYYVGYGVKLTMIDHN